MITPLEDIGTAPIVQRRIGGPNSGNLIWASLKELSLQARLPRMSFLTFIIKDLQRDLRRRTLKKILSNLMLLVWSIGLAAIAFFLSTRQLAALLSPIDHQSMPKSLVWRLIIYSKLAFTIPSWFWTAQGSR